MKTNTHDLCVERTIGASPEVVFDGFIEMYGPERPDWIVDSRLDLRVGGSWRVDFHPPGNDPFTELRTIRELDRPRRLAYAMTAITASGERRLATDVAFSFDLAEGGTRLRLEQRGFPTVEDRDEFAQAWPTVLGLLAERLSA
jgi:uncharacterized protein YndB with AHSA1/START domain